ncbi:hypothetical protein NDU88_004380 [Pleurodeles waltl]|uniref:Uncharacterized protein n=1 Tax=Pleurodeles waltl TaxID=8319 RepID=A0AAV7TSG9_PLEWA|nr:hypothetical protein NDU88_004380 [Pleurodeles waltl]
MAVGWEQVPGESLYFEEWKSRGHNTVAQICCALLSFQCNAYSFLLLRRGQPCSRAAGPGGRGPPTPPRSPRSTGQESGGTAQPRPTRLKRGSPKRVALLFSASIVAIISPGWGTSIRPRRLFSCGGLQIKRLARPQQFYLRSGPRPGARPRKSESDRGAPVPGLTLSRLPSALRARRHGVRVPEGQQGTPATSLHHPPGAPGHSPHQALERCARHSLRWWPHQRAGPGPRARRDAVSLAAILGDLSIRSRPALTARAVLTPVLEVSSVSGS